MPPEPTSTPSDADVNVWETVDWESIAAQAGNVHLAGTGSQFYESLMYRFPEARDRARALFLGAVGLVKLLHPETVGQLDHGAFMTRWDDEPFPLAMLSVVLVDRVDPQGADRPGRLDVVRALWPEELARLPASTSVA